LTTAIGPLEIPRKWYSSYHLVDGLLPDLEGGSTADYENAGFLLVNGVGLEGGHFPQPADMPFFCSECGCQKCIH
jgi:hypothetical protein